MRRAVSGFDVFIGNGKPVRLGVVVPQVHGPGLGRPQPYLQLARRRRSAGDLQRGNFERSGVLLPELLHPHGNSARGIAQVGQPQRAVAVGRMQPGTLGSRALVDREPVGPELRELEGVPDRDVLNELPLLGIELGDVRHPLAG